MSRERRVINNMLYGVFIAAVVLFVLCVPFTKVEESFSLQAIRDIMKLGTKLNDYDHLKFPGVVPRTFLPAIFISILSYPFFTIATRIFNATDLVGLYITRLAIGCVSSLSFFRLHVAVGSKFGDGVAHMFIFITMMQFHLPFYMSRTLPNTFAMFLTNLALGEWIASVNVKRTLYILIFTMICFRCDVLLLLLGIAMHLLLTNRIQLLPFILHCTLATFLSLVSTVLVDSWFWKRWLWPEGEVFYFNTILNKSSEWGVMPFHWYITSALPRALLLAFPLSILGPFMDRRVVSMTFAASLCVFLLSNLGHKEVRFIFPVLPLLNISASVAAIRFVINREKSFWNRCCFLALIVGLLLTFLCTLIMLWASMWNYPGGTALKTLHNINGYSNFLSTKECLNSSQITVHIDVFPAMTGISRFGQLDEPCWIYSKEEGLSDEAMLVQNFTFLVTERTALAGYSMVAEINSFAGFEPRTLWKTGWMTMKMQSTVRILKRIIS